MTAVWQRRASFVVFCLAALIVVVVQFAVIIPGVFTMRLWEDEAFNLTVPLNLIHGLGYTSDGTLSGSELSTFDQRISTGPVVLLPIAAVLALGAEPVIGGRIVVLLFYVGLVAGLWILGSRIGGAGATGRWAALAAVCVPLGWNTWASGSPIQSPADILGEVPSAALVVWSLIMMKRRPWLAGLLVGLAMQAKLIAALSAPAVALGVFLLAPGTFWARVRRVAVCGLVAVVPNAFYELWKLLTLGPQGYWSNLREFYWFFRSGGQDIAPVPPMEKAQALVTTWFSPLWLTVLAALVFVVVLVLVFAHGWQGNRRTTARPLISVLGNDRGALSAVAIIGVLTWSGWWMLSQGTPVWPRHPAPGVYTFVPLLAAVFVFGISRLWARTPHVVFKTVAAVSAVVLAVTIAAQLWGRVQVAGQSRYGEDLADQRAAAAAISDLAEETLVSGWGPEVSVIVLSGAHAGLTDVPRLYGTPQVWRNGDPSRSGTEVFNDRLEERCADVPVRVAAYAICVPNG